MSLSKNDPQTLQAVQATLDIAVDHHLADRLREADALYRKVLKSCPDHPVALHLSGLIAHQTGRNNDALKLMSRALKVEPGYYEAHSNLGLVLAELGRLDEAVARHKKSLAINPAYAEAHNNLGNALQTAGHHLDAVASYRAALKIDPASPDTLSNLGAALAQTGQPHEALECCHKAIALAPGSPENLFNLANVLKDLDRPEEAVSAYHQLLKRHPDDVRALGNLAGALQSMLRVDEAAEYYARAFAASPSASIPIMWLYSASQLPCDIPGHDLSGLIEVAKSRQGDDPEDFKSWRGFARASIEHRRGRHNEAWQLLTRANRLPARRVAETNMRLGEVRNKLLDKVRISITPAPLAPPADGEPPVTLFILGPSRSGKSTLERLINASDGVTRTHEQTILADAMRQTCSQAGASVPTSLADLPMAHAKSFRQHFARQLAPLPGQSVKVVTNTNPHHIEDTLPAAAILPGLRFAFVKRNIDDLTLRIFMKRYNSGNEYAYDIGAITDYIVWYNEMIDALAQRLPDTALIITYEDMIADPVMMQGRIGQLCNIDLTGAALPVLGDDRGCAEPYRQHLSAARNH